MRKPIIILMIVLLGVAASVAEAYTEVRKFKDLSDQHWAAGAVYNLVKMGVIGGYPDGTFRGKRKITRYEVAAFLSKLSDALGGANLKNLKKDLTSIKDQIATLKKPSQIPASGSIETVLKYGNLAFNEVGGHGPVANYRLIASMMQDLGKGTSIKLNIDTMDAGYYGGGGALATRLFDIEGNLKVDPADVGLKDAGFKDPLHITLTVGPGPQQHADTTGVLPGEAGIVYTRPYTGIGVQTKLLGLKVRGGYHSVNQAASGKINTNRVTGGVAYTFDNAFLSKDLELAASGDYYIASPMATGPKDLRANIDVSMPISQKIKLDTHLGVAHSKNSGLMVGAKLHLDDIWNTGTKLSFSGSKIGGQYINPNLPSQFDYAGLDYFSRPLENATVNVGGEVVQKLNKKWVLKGKGDVRFSSDLGYGKNKNKSRATAQVGLAYNIAPQTVFDAFYRVHQDPTIEKTSDITGAGLLYRF